ncbi:transporter substrate-binding domain-containing protein [Isoptericola sp. NPDC019693]|uniref:transporter substrate-binding domain-containing protein n=1 Tax=Isoptericola sp. NPDC019693 TaxID=3364009 RepID=UPI00379F2596
MAAPAQVTPEVRAALAPQGVLRAVVNLGNPVLAQGTPDAPSGVTVDLARELARRLGVPARLECVDAARHSFAAVAEGRADVGFLAVEPERAEQVAFTAPYVLIEGVYAVPEGSPVRTADDVDRPGVRVGVKQGSAYDLFLSRTLARAEVVRGADGTVAFEEHGLEVAAGIRQPLTRYVAEHPGLRVVEPRFTEIRQAVATGRDRDPAAVAWLRDAVAELTADGFVAAALARSGQDATVPSGTTD